MKTILPFLIFFGLLFSGASLQAIECSITHLEAHYSDCDAEGHYDITLSFDYENPVSDSVKVFISNVLIGKFAYTQEPITINNYSSNLQVLVIKVQDAENGDCRQIIESPAPDCNPAQACHISGLEASFSDCDAEGHFDIHINFDVEHPTSGSFKLWLGQVYIGTYPYSQLPITISDYSTNLAYVHIKVADAENPDCYQVIEPVAPDCNPAQTCDISGLEVSFSDCDAEGHFDIHINFDVENPSSPSFKLWISQIYIGTYLYSQLPITISNYSTNLAHIHIKVADAENLDCYQVIEPNAPDCAANNACSITELTADFSDCDPAGTFSVTINFDVNHPTSDSFKVYIAGIVYGPFGYNQRPVTIHGLHSNAPQITIKVADAENLDCRKIQEFLAPDCDPVSCDIVELNATFSDCDSLGHFDITINFDVLHPVSDSFKLWLGLTYIGTYGYNQLPLVIHDYTTNENHVRIKVADAANIECNQVIEPAAPDCASNGDCAISGLHATFSDCDSTGHFNITINFEVENPFGDFFKLYIDQEYLGEYPYSQLPITIPGYSTNHAHITIKVRDAENDDCFQIIEPASPDCASNGDCAITELTAEFLDCDPAGTFGVIINFDVENPISDSFNVFIGGIVYGPYGYNQRPVTILGLHSNSPHITIKVADAANLDCRKIQEFTAPDCGGAECHIYDMTVQFGDCQNGESVYDLTIDFQYENVQNDFFDLKLNHIYYGTFPYDSLPLTIHSYANNSNPLHVIVSDNDHPECASEHNFEAPDCYGIVIYGLRAYPNPGTDKIYLATEGDINNFSNPNTWMMYYGVQKVKTPIRSIDAGQIIFDMTGYPVGLYTLCYQVKGEWKSIHWMKL